jgi:hypothetical protein
VVTQFANWRASYVDIDQDHFIQNTLAFPDTRRS